MREEELRKMIELARKIQQVFPEFYLAGGTAIALKYRHRESDDLDFLTEREISFTRLSAKVRKMFGVPNGKRGDDNIDFLIEGVKVSFVFFPFENQSPTEIVEGIVVASDLDLLLNKIYAAGRRVSWKDPVDAAFLWEKHRWDLNVVKKAFEQKFPGQSFELHVGALCSLEDYPELPAGVVEFLKNLSEKVERDINENMAPEH